MGYYTFHKALPIFSFPTCSGLYLFSFDILSISSLSYFSGYIWAYIACKDLS